MQLLCLCDSADSKFTVETGALRCVLDGAVRFHLRGASMEMWSELQGETRPYLLYVLYKSSCTAKPLLGIATITGVVLFVVVHRCQSFLQLRD